MLGPGLGGFELVIVALVALLVVGPKDLPLLMRKVGSFMGRARQMAAEFRASFDEMARQSELDELRKEVEALRSGQLVAPAKQEAEAALKDIKGELGYQPGWSPAPASAPTPRLESPPGPQAEPQPEPETARDPGPQADVPELGSEPTPAPGPETAPADTPRRRRKKGEAGT